MSNETKTVPVEPTEAMLESGLIALSDSGVEGNDEERLNDAKACYKAMLEAAPAPDDELARLERMITERWCSKFSDFFEINPNSWFSLDYLSRLDKQYWTLRGLLERHPTDPSLVRLREKDDE